MTGSEELLPVLDLGTQHLTGVFPRSPSEAVPSGPLEVVFCPDGGLLQLKQTYSLDQMYGQNYGYRSGLNKSMVDHLRNKVGQLLERVHLGPGDTVLDIGSNDGTLLGAYPDHGQKLVGIDPSAEKFRQFYPSNVNLLVDFFSARLFRRHFGDSRLKLVTSVAMFYDLEDPLQFAREIAQVLSPDGLWHFEQSYMPLMLEGNAYDTVCHEHLEYYGLSQIKWLTDRAGLKIIDVTFNAVNGGSFAVTAAKREAPYPENVQLLSQILGEEHSLGLDTVAPYAAFQQRMVRHRDELVHVVRRLNAGGSTVAGLGASTKGNTMLQFCGLTAMDLAFISEVNPDKFGCYTPGSLIPIVSEAEAAERKADYLVVLPWHFRDVIIHREREFLSRGGKLVFPLPTIEIVTSQGVLV